MATLPRSTTDEVGKEGGLPAPVRADDADPFPHVNQKVRRVKQRPVLEAVVVVVNLHRDVGLGRAVGESELNRSFCDLGTIQRQFSRLGQLGPAGPESFPPRGVAGSARALLKDPHEVFKPCNCLLLHGPRCLIADGLGESTKTEVGVVARVRGHAVAEDLPDARCHFVQEVAIVRDHDNRAGKA